MKKDSTSRKPGRNTAQKAAGVTKVMYSQGEVFHCAKLRSMEDKLERWSDVISYIQTTQFKSLEELENRLLILLLERMQLQEGEVLAVEQVMRQMLEEVPAIRTVLQRYVRVPIKED